MHTRTVRPTPDEPIVTDDPFAELLDALEAEESLRAVDRDDATLQRLFATTPGRRDRATDAPPGSPWPGHNYGPAYRSLRRPHGVRRPTVLAESDLWDVDQLTHEPTPEPEPGPAAPPPWRSRTLAADPHAWLDTLDTPTVDPATTEARLVDLVWGRPERAVLEATEVLQARPRAMAGKMDARERTLRPRPMRLVALGLLLLFALAVLQLLLS